ncbi:MAG: sulfotransferase [Chlorobi bacterium]|nr:sulfotransferase [Chlorobiota bacterium]
MINSDEKRTTKYKKDTIQEFVLSEMNKTLFSKESELIKDFDKPKLPVIFIVGAQRSGTTLLMQLLTQYFELSYPNNFIARYWNVPYIGAVLFKSLSQNINQKAVDLNSDLGYTSGLEGPHEFGYFWKKWFPPESWEEKKYEETDYSILEKQLAAWQSIDNKPLIFKNLIQLDYHIEKLHEIFPDSVFIFLKRNLIYNVQSSYLSGVKLFGNNNELFGVRPSNYPDIKDLPIFERIIKQITAINNDIENQLKKIPENKVLKINYEELIFDYMFQLNRISKKIGLESKKMKPKIQLVSGNKINLSVEKFNQIKELLDSIKK